MTNWYKQAQDALNNFLSDEDRKLEVDTSLLEATGQWMYPFASVKQDGKSQYYIDWFSEKGSIFNIQLVQEGDKVADVAANTTPYWEVSGVDKINGKIYLTPIPPNPHVSGVGAGGREFDWFDYETLSGETERKVVDRIMDNWNAKTVTSPRDVAYLLEGTVPYQFGPNGAQGGWYNPSDTGSNRGGRKYMSEQEIVMADAKILKEKFGFDVPTSALSGQLDARDWGDLISNQYSFDVRHIEPDKLKLFETDKDNFSDPKHTFEMVIKQGNEDPTLKYRNFSVLQGMAQNDDSLMPLLKMACEKISELVHPYSKNIKMDVFWYIKEKAIETARQHKWTDTLKLFETAEDPEVQTAVTYAYEENNDVEGLHRLAKAANSCKAMSKILYAMSKIDPNGTAQYLEPWKVKAEEYMASKDEAKMYYSKELLGAIDRCERILRGWKPLW